LREQLALSLLDIVNAYGAIGQFERAVATGEEALALRRELGNQPILAENLAIVAFGRLSVGDLARARELGEEAYSIGHSLRNNYGLTISAGFLALVYRELGEIERYLDLAAEAVRCGEESGLDRLENFTRIERVWTVGAMGDLQRGFELGGEALASVEAKSPRLKPWCVGALARLHLLNGDLRAAEALLDEFPLASSEEYLSIVMLDSAGGQIVFAHAEFAMAKGDFARAIGILDDLIGWLQRTAARIQLPSALHLKAKVLLGRERYQEARVLLLDARRQAEGVQARFRLWPILATLSQVEEQLGNATQARATRAEARGAIEYVAKHTPADLRDKFVNMPDVRAVLVE
jgi:tetratricopeptide (TPR) repeat protein